jgi:hypothetical protein
VLPAGQELGRLGAVGVGQTEMDAVGDVLPAGAAAATGGSGASVGGVRAQVLGHLQPPSPSEIRGKNLGRFRPEKTQDSANQRSTGAEVIGPTRAI